MNVYGCTDCGDDGNGYNVCQDGALRCDNCYPQYLESLTYKPPANDESLQDGDE